MLKNKNSFQESAHNLNQLAQQAGLMVVAAIATFGMLEAPADTDRRVVIPNQPAFVFANDEEELNNPIKREQEENSPQYISYSVSQRTPARSGKR
jgi:hypothetical protein